MPPFPNTYALSANSPILAMCLPKWEAAMGSCFHFELLVRLLAQKHIAGESVTRDIGGQEGLLTRLFQTLQFSDDEKVFLPKCNTLRNKLIHCEPDALVRIVRELVPGFNPPNNVSRIDLPKPGSGETILHALETQRGAVPVQNTSSRIEGFLGWMMQSATDGTFDHAVSLLTRGMTIIDSKSDQEIPPAPTA